MVTNDEVCLMLQRCANSLIPTLISDILAVTRLPLLQFQVVASDLGTPSLTASPSATVVINVQRNRNPPIFVNEPYSTSVNFNAAPGTSVFPVLADDADTVVSNCRSC